ncbi:hypothetical protein QBC44DRAFT_350836 [Cladorrhinum sp. PSN332]|nr:hypothetical protein QBC44DRAFT_350836 [Cladorrhinum sp. PSN332]
MAIITITITIHPSTHSFSSDTLPPTLAFSLALTSPDPRPITLFTYQTPLSIHDALIQPLGLTITDLTTDTLVSPTSFVCIYRPPPTRIAGPPHHGEKHLIALLPSKSEAAEPVTISTPFGRGSRRPVPREIAETGWETVRNEKGKEIRVGRPRSARGADGLEPGRRYAVGLDAERLKRVWWTFGGKEGVLVGLDDLRERDASIGGGKGGRWFGDYEGWVKGGEGIDWKVVEGVVDVLE